MKDLSIAPPMDEWTRYTLILDDQLDDDAGSRDQETWTRSKNWLDFEVVSDAGELMYHPFTVEAPMVKAIPDGRSMLTFASGTPYELMLASVQKVTKDFAWSEFQFHAPRKPIHVSKGKRARMLWTKLAFELDPHTDTIPLRVFLPLARIHRPHRAGCFSSLTISESTTDVEEASFEFVGLGAGSVATFKEELKNSYSAKTSCSELFVRADLRIEFGWTYVGDEAVMYGSRFRIDNVIEGSTDRRDLPEGLDACERHQPELSPPFVTQRNLLGLSDDDEFSTTIEARVEGSLSIGIDGKLGQAGLPFKAGIKYKREMNHKQELKTYIVGGKNYVQYWPHPTNPLERCFWVTDQDLVPSA